jgi:hypothetical protein
MIPKGRSNSCSRICVGSRLSKSGITQICALTTNQKVLQHFVVGWVLGLVEASGFQNGEGAGNTPQDTDR